MSSSTTTSPPAITTTTSASSSTRTSDCRKFSPNIFNKSKCSHCFRQREEHSAAALECNRVSETYFLETFFLNLVLLLLMLLFGFCFILKFYVKYIFFGCIVVIIVVVVIFNTEV